MRTLPTLSFVCTVAAPFSRTMSGLLPDKLEKMMAEKNDSLLNIFITELAYRHMLTPPAQAGDTPLIVCRENSENEAAFYLNLFRGIVRRAARLRPLYNSFSHRCGLVHDKRLYASELEKLLEKTAPFSEAAKFEIDWKLTSMDDVFVNYEKDCVFTDSPSAEEQRKLVRLWGYLFFVQNVQVFSWANIITDSQGRVNFYNIDSLHNADNALKNFVVKYLRKEAEPKTVEEYKLAASIRHLRHFCPEADLSGIWEEYLSLAPFKNTSSGEPAEKYLDSLRKTEFGVGLGTPVKMTDPQSIAYLLDSRREERMRRRKGNPLLRLGLPFLLILCLLLRYL